MKNIAWAFGLIVLVVCSCGPSAETDDGNISYSPVEAQVNIGSLLKEMVDRDAVARYPSPFYTSSSFSSYDRASKSKERDWFANADNNFFLRREVVDGRNEYVLFDADGPGAVTRWWMTFAGDIDKGGLGIMRIYIDNDPQPAITGTPFQLLSGQRLSREPLASSVSQMTEYERRGHNLYYPIPYAKHCKITYSSNYLKPDGLQHVTGQETVYYNIEYRKYAPGTTVASWTREEAQYYKSEELRAVQKLSNPERIGSCTVSDISGSIEPGQSGGLVLEGPGAIREIAMKIEAEDIPQALRSTTLEIDFDGENTVWIPLGEFFGVGYKPLEASMWNVSASRDGSMSARWVMPFGKDAKIRIVNYGYQSVRLADARVCHSSWDFDAASMHFHAMWNFYWRLNTKIDPVGGARGSYDLNFVNLEGKGVYVGDSMTLYDSTSGWWGEGDEKVYTDGESFPSIFGTGTEDYYGYAWSRAAAIVGHPYLSQPEGSGNLSPGYSMNARHRALDRIPFSKSLVFDMEMLHWNESIMDLGVSTYFYLLPGARVNNRPDRSGVHKAVALSGAGM